MGLGDVVDQLLDQHGLADAGAAEQADLAALGIRREQVDDLDAGDQDLGLGRLIDEGRAPAGGSARFSAVLIGPASSTGSPMTFMMRPSVSSPTGTEIGCAGVDHLLAAHQAFGRIHGDGAHRVLAEMLRDLEHEPVAVVLGLERVQDLRQLAVELHVDDGAHDLAHMTHGALIGRDLRLLFFGLCDHGGLICHAFRSFTSHE